MGTINGEQNDSAGSESRTDVGAIAGGVVGGLAGVGIVVAIVVVLRKRRKRQLEEADTAAAEVAEQAPHRPTLAPYHQPPSSDYISVSTPSDMATAGFAGIGAGDMGAYYDSPALSPSPDLSTKARREAMPTITRSYHPPPSESAATSSNVGSQTGSESSRELLSLRGPVLRTDMVGLRTEVENLRRVVHEIRAERLEAPPEYAE